MGFTLIAIEGQFTNADGSPAIGMICVTPGSEMENDGAWQMEMPVMGALDSMGRIVAAAGGALIVKATDDPATTPIGAYYTFSVRVSGQGLIEFSTGVPSGANDAFTTGAVDQGAVAVEESPIVTLSTLIAAASMIGAVVTSTKFEGSPTILSVDDIANTVTLSENATASGTDDEFTIASGAVMFSELYENAL